MPFLSAFSKIKVPQSSVKVSEPWNRDALVFVFKRYLNYFIKRFWLLLDPNSQSFLLILSSAIFSNIEYFYLSVQIESNKSLTLIFCQYKLEPGENENKSSETVWNHLYHNEGLFFVFQLTFDQLRRSCWSTPHRAKIAIASAIKNNRTDPKHS